MPSKRRLEQLKSARAAAVQARKKRKSETSSVLNAHLEIEDVRLSTVDTSDTEGESGTWFWNDSANESGSDKEAGKDKDEQEDDGHELGMEMEESRTEKASSPEGPQREVKWNKEGEDKLRGVYGIGSRSSLERQRKSARELEKEASKSYDIRALWQRNVDLGMISSANSQVWLDQLPESQPNNCASSSSPLSDIP